MSDKSNVRACQPIALAVDVDGVAVEVQQPHHLMPRVDLIVRETRCDRGGEAVRALVGVPSFHPLPPAPIDNDAVQQVPLATVSVKRNQWVIQDCDITSLSPVVSPGEQP